jgi:hypothetical protein
MNSFFLLVQREQTAPMQPPKFPNVRDYGILRYHQLRYQFCEHNFIPLQWKAMQRAGWTYSNGTYRSPMGTRTHDNSNVMKQEFDACSVRPILHTTSLMSMHDDEIQPFAIQPTNDGLERYKNPCHNREINYMEKIVDLRNDICYQMQLLVEERSVDDAMEEDSTAETESIDDIGLRDNPVKPKDIVRDGT